MTLLARHAAFRRLFLAFIVSEFVEWLATITLAVLVYDKTGDALATTALFVSTKLGPSLLVPILSARSDRLASSAGIGRLLLVEMLLFGAVAAATTRFSLVLICALALLDGTVAALIRALTRATTANTLEPTNHLREGNGLLNVGFAVMNIAGPSAAAVLLTATAPATVLAGGALLLGVVGVYLATGERAAAPHADHAAGNVERLRETWRYVVVHRTAFLLITGEGLVLLMGTLVAPIEVVYAKTTLNSGAAGFGLIVTSWGAGMTAGSLWFTRVRDGELSRLLIASTALLGFGLIGMAAAPSLLVACAAAAIGGAGNGVQWVSAVTAIQESVAADMQLRVAGLFEAVATLVPGLGFLLGGVLAALFSPRVAFAVAGVGILVAAVVAVPLFRAARRRPDAAPGLV